MEDKRSHDTTGIRLWSNFRKKQKHLCNGIHFWRVHSWGAQGCVVSELVQFRHNRWKFGTNINLEKPRKQHSSLQWFKLLRYTLNLYNKVTVRYTVYTEWTIMSIYIFTGLLPASCTTSVHNFKLFVALIQINMLLLCAISHQTSKWLINWINGPLKDWMTLFPTQPNVWYLFKCISRKPSLRYYIIFGFFYLFIWRIFHFFPHVSVPKLNVHKELWARCSSKRIYLHYCTISSLYLGHKTVLRQRGR